MILTEYIRDTNVYQRQEPGITRQLISLQKLFDNDQIHKIRGKAYIILTQLLNKNSGHIYHKYKGL